MLNKAHLSPARTGALASFPNFGALVNGFEKVAERLPWFDAQEIAKHVSGTVHAPNVLNIAMRIFEEEDDASYAERAQKFTTPINERRKTLANGGVRRVSLMLRRKGEHPQYVGETWDEEQAIRNIDPALAYRLKLSCLSNHNLTPCFVENRSIHIYHEIARENQMDGGFFVRAPVRPGRIKGGFNTAGYLVSETDRLTAAVLDSLEIVQAKHQNADCNHISVNFVYNLAVSYEEVSKPLLVSLSTTASVFGACVWRALRFASHWRTMAA